MIAARQIYLGKSAGGGVNYLSYIQSDGSAWVDTGYVPAYWDSFEIEMAATNWTSGGLIWTTSFFGSVPSAATTPISHEPAYTFSPAAADRQFTILPPYSASGGGNGLFWNATAYDGNAYLDGDFHAFKLANYISSYPRAITVDDTAYSIALVQHGWASTDLGAVTTSIAIFGCKTELGTCKFKTSSESNFKFRRLKFYDGDDVLTADIRAAEVGGEVGVYDDIAGTFHAGVDGTLTGVA